MLDKLKSSLRSAIKKIVNSSGVDEELIKELSRIFNVHYYNLMLMSS